VAKELMSSISGKRVFTDDFKKQVLEEAEQRGVAKTLKRHGLASSAFYSWKKNLGNGHAGNGKAPADPVGVFLSGRTSNKVGVAFGQHSISLTTSGIAVDGSDNELPWSLLTELSKLGSVLA
jgi:hypothetical protein